MHNEEHLIQDPEKAKELYKQLSYSEESSLRMQAAFQFKVMLKIDKLLAIDTMQHIIRDANDGDLETISGILDSFVDDDDKLDESLAHADVMQLLKTYVGRLSEKQTV